ncbi:MAG TPA: hypothetical protein PLU82_06430, partial [Oscillospiraceae bacterium]|nr:hypothetical protein [Oscillospiraceae bacterium]
PRILWADRTSAPDLIPKGNQTWQEFLKLEGAGAASIKTGGVSTGSNGLRAALSIRGGSSI